MSTYKHFDEATGQWIVDASGNAKDIELDNELLLDKDEKSISVARGFQKINNKISRLEHHLAWIYLNGAKGGGGSGGGGFVQYTIKVLDSSYNEITEGITTDGILNLYIQIISPRAQKFTLVIGDTNGKSYISGQSIISNSAQLVTIKGITSNTTLVIDALDSAENMAETVYFKVTYAELKLTCTSAPSNRLIYGSITRAQGVYTILNNTGSPVQLEVYNSIKSDPRGSGETPVYTNDVQTGQQSRTINFSNLISTINSNYTIGDQFTFKVTVFSSALNQYTQYSTCTISIVGGDGLSIITLGSQISNEESEPTKLIQSKPLQFTLYIYYGGLSYNTVDYTYKITRILAGQEYDDLNLPEVVINNAQLNIDLPFAISTNNIPVLEEGYYKLHLQAYTSDRALTTSKDLYFNLLEAEQGDLEDYDSGYQLGRFGQKNAATSGTTKWEYLIPKEGPHAYQDYNDGWPNVIGGKMTMSLHKTSTAFTTQNQQFFVTLPGGSYATVDEFKQLLPKLTDADFVENSIFNNGFFIQIAYEVQSNSNGTVLSLGRHNKEGQLVSGFEILSNKITVAVGSENEAASSASLNISSSGLTIVGLNVWSQKNKLKTTTGISEITTYYFAIYLNGIMSKVLTYTEFGSQWNFQDALYLGAREDESNPCDIYVYDLKVYTKNEGDLSIVWNYISAYEQSRLLNGSVNAALDADLRQKNFFAIKGNTCLLCEDPTSTTNPGQYKSDSDILASLTSQYTSASSDYDITYPIIVLTELQSNNENTLSYYTQAAWPEGTNFSSIRFPVEVNIYTKYSAAPLTINQYDDPTKNDSDQVDVSQQPYIYIQGTSSVSYASKNFELCLGYNSKNVAKQLVINDWLPENEFTLKSDVVDSGHVNNVVIGQIANGMSKTNGSATVFGSKPCMSNTRSIRKKIKHSSEGFPCLVFIKYVDGTVALQGIYNFNLGRYAYHNLGLSILKSFEYRGQTYVDTPNESLPEMNIPYVTTEYEEEIVQDPVYSLEVERHASTEAEGFTQGDLAITQHITSVRYTNTDENSAYAAINDGLFAKMAELTSRLVPKLTRTAEGSYVEIGGNWGGHGSNDQLYQRTEIEDYLDLDTVYRYYVIAVIFGLIDSMCKNLVFRTWDGKRWYPCFYDMDSAFQIDNSGTATVSYKAHPNYYFNGTLGSYSYAGNGVTEGVTYTPTQSTKDWQVDFQGMQWNRLWEILYERDIADNTLVTNQLANREDATQTIGTTYWMLRQSLLSDPEKFIRDNFVSYVEQTGPIIYNKDYKIKYVNYGSTWVTNENGEQELIANDSFNQSAFLQGTRAESVIDWFIKRINFLDSVYASYKPYSYNNSSSVVAGEPWNANKQGATSNSTLVSLSAKSKIKVGYTSPQVPEGTRYIWVDDVPKDYLVVSSVGEATWGIYANNYLTTFGNFKNLGWKKLQTLPFKLLEELDLSDLALKDDGEGGEVFPYNLSGLSSLKTLKMENFSGTNTLNVSGCEKLEYLYAANSSLTTITFPQTGTLKYVDLSETPIQQLNNSFNGQTSLKYLNLSNCRQLTSLTLSGLESLEELVLSDNLISISITNCYSLKSIILPYSSSSNQLSKLNTIDLFNCTGLETLNIAGQNNLIRAQVSNCPNLKNVDISNIQLQGGGQIIIDFTILTKLESLNVSSDGMFTELDLRNCPNLNNLNAYSCRNLQTVKCTQNLDNLIELNQSAFRDCGSLTILEGFFELQGPSIFWGCSSLKFDNLLESGKLDLFFNSSDLSNMFRGCSELRQSALDLLYKLDDKVSNMSYMFADSGAEFMITTTQMPFAKCKNVSDLSYIFSNTNISGTLFSEAVINGELYPGILTGLTQLVSIEGAFQRTAVEAIDNDFFHYSTVDTLASVDYAFQDCVNLKSVISTTSLQFTEQPLQSKDFFIKLDATKIHPATKTENGGLSTPNPDYPYPFDVFKGCRGVKMEVNYEPVTKSDGTISNRPYLFHINKRINGFVTLSDQLYSGIDLLMPTDSDGNVIIDASYLFGGISKQLYDGTNTYYIPNFSTITSPFRNCSGKSLFLDLDTINGPEFFQANLTSLTQPFLGMQLKNTDGIPDNIFEGASDITSLQGFFSGIGLNNLNNIAEPVYDFNVHNIFQYCANLANISGIFENCTEFRMRLASNMFINCKLTNVSNAFANSRVIETLPTELFKCQESKLKNMSGVFRNCFNLGYKQDYEFDEIYLDQSNLDIKSGWSDHLVLKGTPVQFNVPYDFFHYCAVSTIKDPINIEGVLADLFWPISSAEPQTGEGSQFFNVVFSKTEFDGAKGPIPNGFFDSPNMKLSTQLSGVFTNTRFEPYQKGDGVNTRGLLYPTDLFNGLSNMQVLNNMFSYTVIDKDSIINHDLFKYDENNYMPLTSLSRCWQGCQFTYFINGSAIINGDQGHPQFDFNMFDNIVTLEDISYMFAGISAQEPTGPHEISDTMFNFKTKPAKPLNINYLFSNAQITIPSNAPYDFGGAYLVNGANTYLQGIPRTSILNSDLIIHKNLAPSNWQDEENSN